MNLCDFAYILWCLFILFLPIYLINVDDVIIPLIGISIFFICKEYVMNNITK